MTSKDLLSFKPCKRGHTGIRNAHGKCVECAKLNQVRYQATEAGRQTRVKKRATELRNEALAHGINADARRRIEEREEAKALAEEWPE